MLQPGQNLQTSVAFQVVEHEFIRPSLRERNSADSGIDHLCRNGTAEALKNHNKLRILVFFERRTQFLCLPATDLPRVSKDIHLPTSLGNRGHHQQR